MAMIIPADKVDNFGSIAAGFGSGLLNSLSQQIPKRMEERRLAQGLQDLASSGLTGKEYIARAAAIPGITPETIRQIGQYTMQEQKAKALQDMPPPPKKNDKFPDVVKEPTPIDEIRSPSLTREDDFSAAQEGYIPKSRKEIMAGAAARYNKSPELYGNNPDNAIAEEEADDKTNQVRAAAYQQRHENLTKIQDNVVTRLRDHSKALNAQIPENVYSKIEDKAIQATKPKKDGGEGLTEQQAKKKYGAEIDEVSRQYSKVKAVGSWGITAKPSKDTLGNLSILQKQFEERNDTVNFADTLIENSKLSPMMAYAIAEPVSRSKEANQYLTKVKPLSLWNLPEKYKDFPSIPAVKEQATLDIAKKIAPLLSNEKVSPLAMAYELDKLGYDSNVFLDYVNQNMDSLNLRKNQVDQLSIPRPPGGTMNDWWLSSFSGLKTGDQ